MKTLLSLILLLIPLSSLAEDILPYQIDSRLGEMVMSTSDELLYIDNKPLFLRSNDDGKFEGQFLYKLQSMEQTPFLDLRVRMTKGSLSVRVERAGKWIEIGQIKGKTDYQELKFNFTHDLEALAKNGVIKIKLISLEKTKFAEVDYIGITQDAPAARTVSTNSK